MLRHPLTVDSKVPCVTSVAARRINPLVLQQHEDDTARSVTRSPTDSRSLVDVLSPYDRIRPFHQT